MFRATQLVGFGAVAEAPAGPIAIAFIGGGSSAADATSYNFGDFTAATDGLLIVALAAFGVSNNDRTIATVSVGGSAATLATDNSAVPSVTGIAYRAVAAGAHNVTLTFSGSMARCTAAVYLLTGYGSPTPADTDRNYLSSSGTSFAITLDFPSGGGIAVYVGKTNGSTTNMSWSSAATDYENNPESGRDEYAHKELFALDSGNVEIVNCGSSSRAYAAAVWS